MSRRRFRYVIPFFLALGLVGASLALAGSGGKSGHGHQGQSSTFFTSLSGRQEVRAIHTKGTGQLKLTMTNSTTFSYELTFSGLSSNATAAHIHFAQFGVSAPGNIIVDLCGGT